MAKDIQGYCVKCKAKKNISAPVQVQMKKKGGGTRPAVKGKCPDCGTTMFRIGGVIED